MKKFMKTAGWQIGAFVLAIGAAFATNAMKDVRFFATEMGYQQMNSGPVNCKDRIQCSTITSENICTWIDGSSTEHNLYLRVEESPNVFKCVDVLYKLN